MAISLVTKGMICQGDRGEFVVDRRIVNLKINVKKKKPIKINLKKVIL